MTDNDHMKAGSVDATRTRRRSMERTPKSWETYEQVARQLISECLESFGLSAMEAKQFVPGRISGTDWEIEGKGLGTTEGEFVIMECRRYPGRRLSQEALGGLAWRIVDTGAIGGIVVSPLPLQDGAAKVAAAANVVPVRLSAESTTTEYVMSFLDQVRLGFHDIATATIHEELVINIYQNGVSVSTETIKD